MIDGSKGLTDEDEAILEAAAGKPCVVIVNKSDLPQQVDLAQLQERFGADKVMTLSAKTLVGIRRSYCLAEELFLRQQGYAGGRCIYSECASERLLREALVGLQDARGCGTGLFAL